MEDLKDMSLVGDGLILIDRPETILRYRACMERLGLEPTKLDSFQIDGLGWSPEIALEMKNQHYLSQGIANPRGIIVTINQENCPVYMPTHSFDRLMMKEFFKKNRTEIADLTTQTGIAVEIDQNMTWYRTIEQVESVRSVHIVAHAGDLAERARHQVRLTDMFMDPEKDHWMEERLRQEIISDFAANGNLYDRHLVITDFEFKGFDEFHTIALGGVYVFRDFGATILTVAEDNRLLEQIKDELPEHVTSLSDPDIIDRICDSGIAGIDFDWYRENPEILHERLHSLALFILSDRDKRCDVHKMSSAQILGEIAKCPAKATKLYEEFELCVSHIINGEQPARLSDGVRALLLHPIHADSRYEENLVWRLICQVQKWPVDVMRLYAVDKNLFISSYLTWSKPMRAAARGFIESYNSQHTYQERI